MIELLASIAVLSIALAAIPVTLRIVGRGVTLARTGSTAVGLAQAKLEELIAAGNGIATGSDTIVLDANAFARRWGGEPSSTGHSGQRVTVSVEWNVARHRITLESVCGTP